MDALKNEVLEILNAAEGKTLLYAQLYEQVSSKNVQRLPEALRQMREAGLITKGITRLPETGVVENRVTLVAS